MYQLSRQTAVVSVSPYKYRPRKKTRKKGVSSVFYNLVDSFTVFTAAVALLPLDVHSNALFGILGSSEMVRTPSNKPLS